MKDSFKISNKTLFSIIFSFCIGTIAGITGAEYLFSSITPIVGIIAALAIIVSGFYYVKFMREEPFKSNVGD